MGANIYVMEGKVGALVSTSLEGVLLVRLLANLVPMNIRQGMLSQFQGLGIPGPYHALSN